MAIVLLWAGSVDEYRSAGRTVEVPRPYCPRCEKLMSFASGYERDVRRVFDPDAEAARRQRIWIHRVWCSTCKTRPGLLPSFCLARRLDAGGVIGRVITAVAGGTPVSHAADEQAIPRSTARGWIGRFVSVAPTVSARFAAVAIELGSGPFDLPSHPMAAAVEAIGRGWEAARRRLAGNVVGVWRFVSQVSGGALLATDRSPP